jgi:hypothetical protein
MSDPALNIDTTKPASVWLHIASTATVDVDLTAVSGAYKGPAQIVRLNNASAAALTAILIPVQKKASNGSEGVVSQAIVVNAGQQYEVPIPIKKIVAAGSGALSADCFWWNGSTLQLNI